MKSNKKPYKQFGIRIVPNVAFGVGVYFACFGFFFFLISSLVFLGIEGDVNGGSIGICFGLVFAGIGIGLALFSTKKKRQNKKIKLLNRYVKAQVVGDIINPNVHINGKSPNRLVAKYEDGFSEPRYFESDDLYIVFDLNKAKGCYLDVYLDGENYYIDLCSITEGTLIGADAERFGTEPSSITNLPSLSAFLDAYPDGNKVDEPIDFEEAYIPSTPIDEFNPFDVNKTDDDPFN